MDIRKFFAPKVDAKAGPSANDSELSNETSQGVGSLLDMNIARKNLIPLDLPNIGEPINQIRLRQYPREKDRSFRAEWYDRFKWLIYSVVRDAAYCYPCMQFEPHSSKETSFTIKGFRFWKRALDQRGFPRHEKCVTHIQAMQKWNEKIRRDNMNLAVSTLACKRPLEQNRYYVKSIAEIIQFIAVNELALRGEYNLDEHIEESLFIRLFQYTLKKDKELADCYLKIPKNACYTSPEIQNEVIDILTEIVRENICSDIKSGDVKYFTLLEDGTKDKNQRENISIGIRYVKNGEVRESLLAITTTVKLDAATFTEKTLDILDANGLDQNNMLSQCYDGASVMSGKRGGVAARIESALQKKVPYVHCFNHRLHLVVIRVVSDIVVLRLFFEQCITFHEFFQHPKVHHIYEGKNIGRLLEQRWTGHLAVTKVIRNNFQKILQALEKIPHEKFDGDTIAKSLGLYAIMKKIEFRFALVLSHKILSLLECANNALESRKTSLKDAIVITKIAVEEIRQLRNESKYLEILNQALDLLPETDETEECRVPKRKRKRITKEDYLFTDYLPSTSTNCENDLKRQYMETIDLLLAEFEKRFDDNDELITAISNIDQFDLEKLQYLSTLGE